MKYWLVLLMLLPGAAAANAYKCTDQQGGTVYSTTPCDEAPGLVPYVEGGASAAGELIVHKGADGSYRTPGAVNGSPLTLVIDSGAARTTISPDAAQEAGAQCGKRVPAGRACPVTVHEIDVGEIELDDIVVYITPGMRDDVRLGRNALRRLNVRQDGGALHLSRR